MESEKERIELIRPYCSKCKSPMHPRYGYYRCFNCGNKRYFTEKEQLFWEKEERSKPRSN